jgi:methionyl aminopeptidase
MIRIKSPEQIMLISRACEIAACVLQELGKSVAAGVATGDLDRKAEQLIRGFGARSAFKGYRGFPANICVSVNEEIVHGVPGRRCLKESDIVSIDVGVESQGYYGDAAWTFGVGKVPPVAQRLLEVTKEALLLGINQAFPGNRLFDISHEVQQYVEMHNFSVVREFVGHGVGAEIHEDPQIPNYGEKGTGPVLKPGMVLAIEPMVNAGTFEIEILADRWTAVTKDRKLSAHFEHTICVKEDGPEILTVCKTAGEGKP